MSGCQVPRSSSGSNDARHEACRSTCLGRRGVKERARRLGFHYYLAEPASFDLLFSAVKGI